jgi:DnaK suppressor protein
MSPDKQEQYRRKLLELRDRLMGEMNHIADAIQEDAATLQSLSSVPIHLADVAPEGLDADVHVLETERGMVEQITAALNRIGDGTYGTCESCGRAISEARLQAIPYATLCIACAREGEQNSP